MKNKLLRVLSLFTILSACTKDSNEISDIITIEGIVKNNSFVLTDASVIIDSKINWSTTTDENGYFKITNVNRGEHELSISKEFDEGNFIEKSYDINSNTDVQLNQLILPNSVILEEPSEITINSIKLVWNESDANDFREYKIYRKTDSGLDENTGELVHVSTSKKYTFFVDDNLLSGQQYFYRIYVMNDFGRLGGSNIVRAVTKTGNLITYGSFEDDSILNFTQVDRGSMNLDSTIRYNGNKSLNYKYDGGGTSSTAQIFKQIYLKPNTNYKFSCWFKGKGIVGSSGYWHFILELTASGGVSPELRITEAIGEGTYQEYDWKYQSEIFNSGNQTGPYTIKMINEIDDLWIDDLELIEL